MAVVKNMVQSTLQLYLEKGVNENGDPVFGRKSFNNIKVNAADQDVYDAGTILAGLQKYALNGIFRINKNALDNE
ncbi:hypothetical protein JOC37_000043 [Desulfohalotomaculum tongense]|uniref:DUF1659 domain-containing protein n=1 Tax=Desulforadius tongensis TaxID=1216062 RepID=UPI00195C0C15|nr:DUF1659 domain-containing protein [Desulforadius tongensis]MBM7853678.1 hypothetical protein [Desulforadius tongensis]